MSVDPIGPAIGAAIGAAAKPVVEWTIERIKELAAKHRSKDISFVKDPSEVDALLIQRKDLEFRRYKKYLRDKDRSTTVLLGLRLRKLAEIKPGETDAAGERRRRAVAELKDLIRRRYGTEGLHLAQAAQAEVLGIIIDKHEKLELPAKVREDRIVRMIEEISKHIRFVEEFDSPEALADEIAKRLKWDEPPLFFIAGSGSARTEARAVSVRVAKALEAYPVRLESVDAGIRHVYIFLFPPM